MRFVCRCFQMISETTMEPSQVIAKLRRLTLNIHGNLSQAETCVCAHTIRNTARFLCFASMLRLGKYPLDMLDDHKRNVHVHTTLYLHTWPTYATLRLAGSDANLSIKEFREQFPQHVQYIPTLADLEYIWSKLILARKRPSCFCHEPFIFLYFVIASY